MEEESRDVSRSAQLHGNFKVKLLSYAVTLNVMAYWPPDVSPARRRSRREQAENRAFRRSDLIGSGSRPTRLPCLKGNPEKGCASGFPAPRSDNLVFTNERELEELLSSRGWMIFHPEEHSLEEQLEVFASGEVVMGCIGSAFHTLLLMKNPRSRYIVINRMNGEREAHNLQFDLIAKARTGNYYIWDVPKHDAPPLRRRKTHHSWPWYAFDLDVIRRALDVSDDFAGTMDCPGMVPISARETTNSVGPLLCRLDISLWDRLYYFYRRLRKAGRPAKEAWVSFQQRLWKSFR